MIFERVANFYDVPCLGPVKTDRKDGLFDPVCRYIQHVIRGAGKREESMACLGCCAILSAEAEDTGYQNLEWILRFFSNPGYCRRFPFFDLFLQDADDVVNITVFHSEIQFCHPRMHLSPTEAFGD